MKWHLAFSAKLKLQLLHEKKEEEVFCAPC